MFVSESSRLLQNKLLYFSCRRSGEKFRQEAHCSRSSQSCDVRRMDLMRVKERRMSRQLLTNGVVLAGRWGCRAAHHQHKVMTEGGQTMPMLRTCTCTILRMMTPLFQSFTGTYFTAPCEYPK
jgi:hypothetical protein